MISVNVLIKRAGAVILEKQYDMELENAELDEFSPEECESITFQFHDNVTLEQTSLWALPDNPERIKGLIVNLK